MYLAGTVALIAGTLQISEINIKSENNMLKIPIAGRQTSWLFTKRGLGIENGATVKQIQEVRAGLEPGASRLQVRRPNHLATPPPYRLITTLTALSQPIWNMLT